MTTTVETNKTAALDRVETHANPAWKERVNATIARLAHAHAEITTDMVWASLGDDVATHEPRALGPLMKSAATRGLIEKTARTTQCTRPVRNGGDVRVWRSRVFGG
jgi:hypothetical protein